MNRRLVKILETEIDMNRICMYRYDMTEQYDTTYTANVLVKYFVDITHRYIYIHIL